MSKQAPNILICSPPSNSCLIKTLEESVTGDSSTLSFFEESLNDLVSSVSPAMHPSASNKQLAEQLFDATASVKIAMSQVSMHIGRLWRDKLFRQIDSLHDLEEWDEDDNPINKESFVSFIKEMILIKPELHPGLGLSYKGYLIAAWTRGNDRLTIEFLPNERAKWLVSKCVDGEIERATGVTSLSRLPECIAPYKPGTWFQEG